jgi:hypothetical protein
MKEASVASMDLFFLFCDANVSLKKGKKVCNNTAGMKPRHL